ncbi:hypothetical protein L6452_00320 [Arctium lappa]|uniref:Uncharacterized protein n=1 Tax=Arctium lappa TaxID=4217 RepID=A0ACB9FEE3_ARCLA|nr:hypothetical protein L6452_00320 [Arctium lappa]
MDFDPTNPLPHRHHGSSQALIQKYFHLEVEFMAAPGYHKQRKFIDIRSIAISDIEKYADDEVDLIVIYLAITYFDRFLSRNINIPVIKSGEDIRFTKFRPSTIAASAILVTSYKLISSLHSETLRKVFRCGFIQQSEVEGCFAELKEHALPDWWKKGKELMIHEPVSRTRRSRINEIVELLEVEEPPQQQEPNPNLVVPDEARSNRFDADELLLFGVTTSCHESDLEIIVLNLLECLITAMASFL